MSDGLKLVSGETRAAGPAARREGRTYWRSLDELAGSPEFASFLEREFPEGASEPPQGIPRRQMLMLLGASLSLAGLTACRRPVEKIVPYVAAPEEVVPGIPRHYATSMPFGLDAYGLVVESHEGRPTKIEGNTLHPATRGATSARTQASILDLYDPDRSRFVRRAGKRAGWDEFVAHWKGLHADKLAAGGAGLAVLAAPFASPTLERLAAELRERFPDARWAIHDPAGPQNELDGLKRATGRARRAVHRLEQATTIVALDADLFVRHPDNVALARGFAAGRRSAGEGGSMNRLWVAECEYSTTGAMADHRVRVRRSEIAAVLGALARELQAAGLRVEAPATPAPVGVDPQWLRALAGELLAQQGRSAIVAGSGQPPEVHAAVLELNAALGNVGRAVDYDAPAPAGLPDRGGLAALVEAMRGGQIDTLVMLGVNPVYDAPADLEFAAALGQVANTIHAGSHVDETAARCAWHVPLAHYLEAWGDCRAAGGALGVTQPLIAPLFGARSTVEMLALLHAGEERAGHDEVRRTWTGLLGQADFERKWRRVLHDGVWDGGERAAAGPTPALRGSALRDLRAPSAPGRLEISFCPSATVGDGGQANNGWLQELPDPVTKLTWGHAALLSPQTMKSLGLANEDIVTLRYRERKLELPVWAVPGQADGTISVPLGYGRTAAGRVGNGVGVDAYSIRTTAAADFDGGAEIAATGAKAALACTQDHGSMEGRALVREATLEDYRRDPEFAKKAVELPPLKQMIGDHDYSRGPQWGMSIDLNVCTGCSACVTACQSENNVPIVGADQVRHGREMHWLRIDRYFAGREDGAEPAPEMAFQPMPCMHCENAPCEQVCPVAATVHDSEGLNVMVYNRCIGTRYCSNNCPYKVRRFNFFNLTKDTPELLQMAQNPDVTVRSRGVMEKCTYCLQRISAAKIDARLDGRELRDGDVQTACQQACPTGAIVFGDVLDPESRVARLKRLDRDYTVLEELNNRPRTTFLARLRNPHPELVPS